MPDRLIELKTGTEVKKRKPDAEAIKEYEGKDFKVRTLKAQLCHLCGYDMDFKKTVQEYEDGTKEEIGVTYLMKAKDFVELDVNGRPKSDKSVLPEIIFKLRRAKVIEIIERTSAEKKKTDAGSKKKDEAKKK